MNNNNPIKKSYIRDTIHSMKRRCEGHNYSGRGIYMVTFNVLDRKPLLGTVKGNPNMKSGEQGCPYTEYSELTRLILRDVVDKHNELYPMVKLWKIQVMPDHIHMILYVKEPLPDGKDLGNVIGGFKTGCSKAWKRLRSAELGHEAPFLTLFEDNFVDKILHTRDQLNKWNRYLSDNPRRYLIKYNNPKMFTVWNDMDICGRKCQAIGNRFLLDVPEKVAVIVHRAYTDSDFERLKEEWLECGERGGVLVSASIAPREKEVMREAMNRKYRIILLRENGFPKLYKPAGEGFYACAEGRLLQVCPWEYHFDRRTITREQCLALNRLAEDIAEL